MKVIKGGLYQAPLKWHTKIILWCLVIAAGYGIIVLVLQYLHGLHKTMAPATPVQKQLFTKLYPAGSRVIK